MPVCVELCIVCHPLSKIILLMSQIQKKNIAGQKNKRIDDFLSRFISDGSVRF